MPEADSGMDVGVAIATPDLAWEGQPRFVTVLRSESGESFEGATVELVDPAGPLQIVEQRCAAECAVVLRIHDRTTNTGESFPSPSAAAEAYLDVRIPDAPPKRALVRVMPLDTVTEEDLEVAQSGGLRLASSVHFGPSTALAGSPGGTPIRWLVFGDVVAGGTIDVSARGAMPGPGGYGGGQAEEDGRGPGGGGAGIAGAGGGGGGHGSEGMAGAGSGDEPGGGGAGGFVDGTSCALDFAVEFGCGGSGGGGGEGEGGGGGGTIAIVSLSELDLSNASVRSVGGDGSNGGGGGAGGAIALAAPTLHLPEIELAGGSGDGRGGAGGRGVLEVQTAEGALDGEVRAGPAVDLEGVALITDRARVKLDGRAAPDSLISVELIDGETFHTVADVDGTFSLDVELRPGLNRMRVVQDGGIRSWVGTSIEMDVHAGEASRPTGALLDIAYLP